VKEVNELAAFIDTQKAQSQMALMQPQEVVKNE
jgi:hypothetical protein